MKETVTEYHFIDTFKKSVNYKNNFSYQGLVALFEYIEQYEDDFGEEFEFDMIGLCCDYTEYSSLAEFNTDYGDVSVRPWKYETLEDIRDATLVIEIPETDRFIIGDF